MTTLIIATRNAHKAREISEILGRNFRLLTLESFSDAPRVVEDQLSFAKNAAKKARELAKWLTYMPNAEFRIPGASASVLADDSGLEVDALNGAPGVHSARFAAMDNEKPAADAGATNSPDADNNAKLLRLLKDVPSEKRTARFRCVLSVVAVKPPQHTLPGHLFDATCEGRIALHPSGEGGFGYDALFIPSGYSQSFAELSKEVKNQISHRAQALEKMRKAMESLVLGSEFPKF
jgi:XTP/dITP diphosphohydrolase